MSEIKEVWVLKWALTEGVVKRAVHSVTSDGWVNASGLFVSVLLGRDCAETETQAIALAHGLRLKRIASLKKQIAKLEKLRFGSQP